MYQDEKAKLAETIAEYERLRKFLRDLDAKAGRADKKLVEIERALPTTTLAPTARQRSLIGSNELPPSRTAGKNLTLTTMPAYRIVKWCPEQPETKQPACGQVFSDLALAESIKTTMEKYLTHTCFAVELITEPSREPPAE